MGQEGLRGGHYGVCDGVCDGEVLGGGGEVKVWIPLRIEGSHKLFEIKLELVNN